MKCVVDASVAVKWLVEEPGSAEARLLLAGGDSLLAPELLVPEVCNATWKKHLRKEVSREHALRVVQAVPTLFDLLCSCAPLAERAFEIASELEHPAYDCFYLALAEQESCRLVTDDARLLQRLEDTPWATRVKALRDA